MRKLLTLFVFCGLALSLAPAVAQTTAPPPWPMDVGRMQTTASGLQYQILHEGTGAVPQPGQTVVANYHGTLLNGTKFDSSFERGQPFSFPLGQGRVIKGWDEAFAMFKVGTRAIIILPPSLGYGASGAGNVIPPNATLRFDVELVGVR